MTSVRLCRGEHEDHTRIFHARYTTSRGRTLEGGTATSDCVTRTTPPGRQLTGFHDRAGDELDSLGLIYTRGNPHRPTASLTWMPLHTNPFRTGSASVPSPFGGRPKRSW